MVEHILRADLRLSDVWGATDKFEAAKYLGESRQGVLVGELPDDAIKVPIVKTSKNGFLVQRFVVIKEIHDGQEGAYGYNLLEEISRAGGYRELSRNRAHLRWFPHDGIFENISRSSFGWFD